MSVRLFDGAVATLWQALHDPRVSFSAEETASAVSSIESSEFLESDVFQRVLNSTEMAKREWRSQHFAQTAHSDSELYQRLAQSDLLPNALPGSALERFGLGFRQSWRLFLQGHLALAEASGLGDFLMAQPNVSPVVALSKWLEFQWGRRAGLVDSKIAFGDYYTLAAQRFSSEVGGDLVEKSLQKEFLPMPSLTNVTVTEARARVLGAMGFSPQPQDAYSNPFFSRSFVTQGPHRPKSESRSLHVQYAIVNNHLVLYPMFHDDPVVQEAQVRASLQKNLEWISNALWNVGVKFVETVVVMNSQIGRPDFAIHFEEDKKFRIDRDFKFETTGHLTTTSPDGVPPERWPSVFGDTHFQFAKAS